MFPTGQNSIQLKELSQKHKEVASLLAQGLKPGEVAAAIGFTREYVTFLCRDPLFLEYIRGQNDINNARLDSMFESTVSVIKDGLNNAATENQLRAARLQMEASGRLRNGVGSDRRDPAVDHLAQLANRLVDLLGKARTGETYNGQVTESSVQ